MSQGQTSGQCKNSEEEMKFQKRVRSQMQFGNEREGGRGKGEEARNKVHECR